jgi:hypothetical protein
MVTTKRCALGLTGFLVALVSWNSSAAQTDTGRHADLRRHAPDTELVERDWSLAIGAGVMASGDVIKVRVNSGNDLVWRPPAGGEFSSERFTVTLDEAVQIALSGAWRPARRLWLRGDLSWARQKAAALALVGQTVEPFLYDEWDVILAGLAVEYRLTQDRTYPYALVGGVLAVVRSRHDSAVDQDRWSLRLGAGLNHDIDRRWSLRIEVRDTLVDLDLEDYRPTAAGVPNPNLSIQTSQPQQFWEIFAAIRLAV